MLIVDRFLQPSKAASSIVLIVLGRVTFVTFSFPCIALPITDVIPLGTDISAAVLSIPVQ